MAKTLNVCCRRHYTRYYTNLIPCYKKMVKGSCVGLFKAWNFSVKQKSLSLLKTA